MISKEDFAVMQALHQRGVYQKDIAEQLQVHPKTVKRALQRQGAPEREGAQRGSKLDAHKEKVDQLLSEGIWNARVILREIQRDGYEGCYSILLEDDGRFHDSAIYGILRSDWATAVPEKLKGDPACPHLLTHSCSFTMAGAATGRAL